MESLDSKNFKINGSTDSPANIDYDIYGFSKKRTIIKGVLTKVEYFRYFDGTTYDDLIIEENRVYNRDAIGIVQTRDVTINFFYNDGTIGETKSWTKYYNPDESIQEGMDRRNNMISAAKTVLLRELKLLYGEPTNQSYGFDLLTSVKAQMDYFKDGYAQPLRDAITNSTKPYLNANIKTLIVDELTF